MIDYCCCFKHSNCCYLDTSILLFLSIDHEKQEAAITLSIFVKCNIFDSDKSSYLNNVTEAHGKFIWELHTYDTCVYKNNNDR